MRKDVWKVAGVFLGGVTIGSILQYILDHKTITTLNRRNDELTEAYNERTKETMHLQADVACAKVLNAQVATYACNLKKALDDYEEGFS